MERNGKQVGCNAHDNNAMVVREWGSGSNRLDSMEKESRRPFLFYFSSFFLSLRWGFGSDQTRTEAMEDLLQLGAPPPV